MTSPREEEEHRRIRRRKRRRMRKSMRERRTGKEGGRAKRNIVCREEELNRKLRGDKSMNEMRGGDDRMRQ